MTIIPVFDAPMISFVKFSLCLLKAPLDIQYKKNLILILFILCVSKYVERVRGVYFSRNFCKIFEMKILVMKFLERLDRSRFFISFFTEKLSHRPYPYTRLYILPCKEDMGIFHVFQLSFDGGGVNVIST